MSLELANLPKCWRGSGRLWFLSKGASPVDDEGVCVQNVDVRGVVGTTYSNQCYCLYYSCFVNPNGHTCRQCKDHLWPYIERWRVKLLPELMKLGDDNFTAAEIIEDVRRWKIDEVQALELGKGLDLPRFRDRVVDALRNPHGYEKCDQRGEQLEGDAGWRDCPTCRGEVKLKVFACPYHPEGVTIPQECRTCEHRVLKAPRRE